MSKFRVILAAAMAVPLLALAGAAVAQDEERYPDTELAPRAREAAEAARVRPLIEAEKLRPRLDGVWKVERFIPTLMTSEGKLPPMTPAARRLYNKRIADRKAGKTDDPVEYCLPPGTPRGLFMDAPFLITQAPVKVTLFHQYQHLIQHVFLDGPLKNIPDLDPLWQGTSSGRWEGDTLVIETAGFNGQQWLDQAGLPQSEQMIVTERLRRVDPTTLEAVITFDDKANYSAPWSTTVRFKRLPDDTLFQDHNCMEKFLEFPHREYGPDMPIN